MLVQLFRYRLHPFQNHLRLLADTHEDDTFHGLLLLHVSELPEPWSMSDLNFRDVLNVDWNSALLLQHDVPDIRCVAYQT